MSRLPSTSSAVGIAEVEAQVQGDFEGVRTAAPTEEVTLQRLGGLGGLVQVGLGMAFQMVGQLPKFEEDPVQELVKSADALLVRFKYENDR